MLPAKELPDKIEIIQSLRGVAALGVMITHLWHQQDKIIIEPTLKQIAIAGSYGIQVFFIISGFILLYSLYKHNYKVDNYFRFIGRRLIRLEPAYLVSILLVILFDKVISPALQVTFMMGHYTKLDLLLHLLYMVPFYRGANWVQGVNWTLAIEFQFYVLIGLIAPLLLTSRYNKYVKHFVLVILLIISSCYYELTFFIPWLSFFAVGMACFLWVTKQFAHVDMLAHIAVACVVNYFVFKSLYFVILLCITPVIIHSLLYKKVKLFSFLGKISYSLYLVHCVVGIFTIHFFQEKLNMRPVYMQLMALLVAILISIFCSYVFYLLLEKPFTRIAKKISL